MRHRILVALWRIVRWLDTRAWEFHGKFVAMECKESKLSMGEDPLVESGLEPRKQVIQCVICGVVPSLSLYSTCQQEIKKAGVEFLFRPGFLKRGDKHHWEDRRMRTIPSEFPYWKVRAEMSPR